MNPCIFLLNSLVKRPVWFSRTLIFWCFSCYFVVKKTHIFTAVQNFIVKNICRPWNGATIYMNNDGPRKRPSLSMCIAGSTDYRLPNKLEGVEKI